MGVTPKSSILMRSEIFHHKPSILGYPHLWNIPHPSIFHPFPYIFMASFGVRVSHCSGEPLVFGYRLTRRPRRVVNFCYSILYTSMLCKVGFGHGTVGWGGAKNVPWHLHTNMTLHDAMLEMGWGGAHNVPWHLHTYMMLC